MSPEAQSQRSHLPMHGLDDFVGTWTVHRTVVDRLNACKIKFAGTAVISRYHFEESGETRAADVTLRSYRKYILGFSEHGRERRLSRRQAIRLYFQRNLAEGPSSLRR